MKTSDLDDVKSDVLNFVVWMFQNNRIKFSYAAKKKEDEEGEDDDQNNSCNACEKLKSHLKYLNDKCKENEGSDLSYYLSDTDQYNLLMLAISDKDWVKEISQSLFELVYKSSDVPLNVRQAMVLHSIS